MEAGCLFDMMLCVYIYIFCFTEILEYIHIYIYIHVYMGNYMETMQSAHVIS